MRRLASIAETFGVASLLSFGGTNAVVPHLRREMVAEHAWMTDDRFAEAYAVAQIMPGPSTTIVTLLGYQAGGVTAAAVATIAMILPSCVLAYACSCLWQRSGTAPWHKVLEKGLEPVAIGLIGAAGLVLAHAVDRNTSTSLITVAACVALTTTETSPLLAIALGGVAGLIIAA